jgi:hypothetical protein
MILKTHNASVTINHMPKKRDILLLFRRFAKNKIKHAAEKNT